MFVFLRKIAAFVGTLVFITCDQLFPENYHHIITNNYAKFILFVSNLKVNTYGNKSNVQQRRVIFMANHYDIIDWYVLYPLLSEQKVKLYSIGKDDLLGISVYNKKINIILRFFIQGYYNLGNVLAYIRGNKNSGDTIRKHAMSVFNENSNLLVFPEGQARRGGIITQLKPGMFEIANQEKVSIVPITLKYKKYNGSNKGEPTIMEEWFDTDVDIFIHEPVSENNILDMIKITSDRISSKIA